MRLYIFTIRVLGAILILLRLLRGISYLVPRLIFQTRLKFVMYSKQNFSPGWNSPCNQALKRLYSKWLLCKQALRRFSNKLFIQPWFLEDHEVIVSLVISIPIASFVERGLFNPAIITNKEVHMVHGNINTNDETRLVISFTKLSSVTVLFCRVNILNE